MVNRKFFYTVILIASLLIVFAYYGKEKSAVKQPPLERNSFDEKPTSSTGNPAFAVRLLSITPDPVKAEKAVTIKIKTSGDISKVFLEVKGAEHFTQGKYFLKRQLENEWAISFIAPLPGEYPMLFRLYEAADRWYLVSNQRWILKVTGELTEVKDPEKLVTQYFLNLAKENPQLYKSIEVKNVEEIKIEPESKKGAPKIKKFRIEVLEKYWDPTASARGRDGYFVYYVEVRQDSQQAPWYITNIDHSP